MTKLFSTTAPDFSVFYQTAQNLLAYRNIYQDPTLYTGFGYPPMTAVLFIPLALLPYEVAQALWVLVSALTIPVAVYLSMRLFEIPRKVPFFLVVLALALLSFPAKFTLGMGQVNFVALVLLLASAVLMVRPLAAWSGLLLSLLLLIKPHFVLLLPFLFVGGHRRPVMISLFFIAASVLVTGIWFGWEQFQVYAQETLPALLVFQGREIYYNQSLGAALARVLPDSTAAALTLVGTAAFYLGALGIVWRKKLKLPEMLAVSLPVFLFIEPLAWQHHFVFLLPVFLWLWRATHKQKWPLVFMGASYLLISLNIKQPHLLSATLWGNLVLSHVFWGNAVIFLLVAYVLARHRASG